MEYIIAIVVLFESIYLYHFVKYIIMCVEWREIIKPYEYIEDVKYIRFLLFMIHFMNCIIALSLVVYFLGNLIERFLM